MYIIRLAKQVLMREGQIKKKMAPGNSENNGRNPLDIMRDRREWTL